MALEGLGPCTLELMDRYDDPGGRRRSPARARSGCCRAADHGVGLARRGGDGPVDVAEVACRTAGASSRARPRTRARPTGSARPAGWRSARWSSLGVARMEDVGVPRSRIPASAGDRGIAERRQIRIATFGHAGDGNLHPNFILDRDADEAASAARPMPHRPTRSRRRSPSAARSPPSTASASRRATSWSGSGAPAVAVMRAIKGALDPRDLLNPGRVLGLPTHHRVRVGRGCRAGARTQADAHGPRPRDRFRRTALPIARRDGEHRQIAPGDPH